MVLLVNLQQGAGHSGEGLVALPPGELRWSHLSTNPACLHVELQSQARSSCEVEVATPLKALDVRVLPLTFYPAEVTRELAH